MIGLGTLLNAATIIVGASIGLMIGHKLPERIHNTLFKAASLITIGIGIKMFFEMKQVLIVIGSLILGGLIGELLDVESWLERFGTWLKKISHSKSETFLDGFVTCSLLYCVGPMAILGAIAEGLNGQHDILFTKAILDGTVSISFATALGVGVLFSFIPIVLYQGALTIAALALGHFFNDLMISELTATGGILLIAIGLNILGVFGEKRKIAVGNMLPALFFAPLFARIFY